MMSPEEMLEKLAKKFGKVELKGAHQKWDGEGNFYWLVEVDLSFFSGEVSDFGRGGEVYDATSGEMLVNGG